MRFLCDMGVSLKVVQWLRKQGHEITHLRDEGLQTLPNGEIFSKASAGTGVQVPPESALQDQEAWKASPRRIGYRPAETSSLTSFIVTYHSPLL